jgi:hypothetical protein
MTEEHAQNGPAQELKGIHVGLFLLSVSLIIALSATKELQLSKALVQVTQIQELVQNWDKVRRKLLTDAARPKNEIFGSRFSVAVSSKPVVDADTTATEVAIDSEQLTAFKSWEFSVPMQDPPGSLAAFRSWWNSLNQGASVFVPQAFDSVDLKQDICRVTVGRKSNRLVYESDTWGTCQLVDGSSSIFILHAKTSWSDIETIRTRAGERNAVYLNLEPDAEDRSNSIMRISIPFNPLPSRLSESEMRNFYGDWRNGTFEDAFPELFAASSDFQTVSIASASERIKELQSNGDHVIEAFGLKIPAGQVTRWGGIILIAVQIYFLVQLSDLLRKVRLSDPVWTVSWIALYKSRIAFGLTLFSACVVPFVAACLIGRQVRITDHPILQMICKALILLLSAIVSAVTTCRLMRLHSMALGSSIPAANSL